MGIADSGVSLAKGFRLDRRFGISAKPAENKGESKRTPRRRTRTHRYENPDRFARNAPFVRCCAGVSARTPAAEPRRSCSPPAGAPDRAPPGPRSGYVRSGHVE
ncbi:hypothetical protein GCM10022205_31730 [Spinactinospora alkalitolerans]